MMIFKVENLSATRIPRLMIVFSYPVAISQRKDKDIGRMRSLALEVVDDGHECKSDTVEVGAVEASFVDGAGGSVGGGSRKSNAEGPAGLVELNSTLVGTLPQLVFASFVVHAFLVLIGAPLSDACLHVIEGVSLDASQDEQNKNENFHDNQQIINQEFNHQFIIHFIQLCLKLSQQLNAIWDSSIYPTHIFQTSQLQISNVFLSIMLSQRQNHPKIQTDNLKGKSAKPFSLLSIGLSKMPGLQSKHRNWEMQDHRHHINKKKQIKNNENKDIKCEVNGNNLNKKENTQQESNYAQHMVLSTTFMRVEQHHESQLNEDIIFTNQKISFQNISNVMMDESDHQKKGLEKENSNFLNLGLGYYQEESQQKERGEKLVVNLKKKIKKLDRNIKVANKSFTFENVVPFDFEGEIGSSQLERENLSLAHDQFISNPLSDRQVYPESYIYRNQIISQRIDNDVDSDDQQVDKGIQRLHKFLSDAIIQQQQTTSSYR